MDYTQLLNTMVIFVVLMAIGYIGARINVLNRDFSKAASKLVMNVFLSASILNSVIGDQPEISGAQLWMTLLILTLVMVLCCVVGAVVVRGFKLGGKDAPIMELLMSMPNTMFVGLPIVQELYGSTAVLYIALSCIPFNVILYSYGIWRLKSANGAEGDRVRLKDMLSVPLVVTVLSLLVFFFHIQLPTVLVKLTTTLAPATMPMSMIVIGATLGSVNLLDAFKEKRCYIVCFFRLIVAPVLIWLVLSLLPMDPVLLATGVVIAGCPSGVVITVLALQYDYDAVFSSKGVLAATTLSMLTLPLVVYFLL